VYKRQLKMDQFLSVQPSPYLQAVMAVVATLTLLAVLLIQTEKRRSLHTQYSLTILIL
jgi:hypothetical protein